VDLGSKVFLEFRGELARLRKLFDHFDQDDSGYLDKGECWVALNVLGLMPPGKQEEEAVMDVIQSRNQELMQAATPTGRNNRKSNKWNSVRVNLDQRTKERPKRPAMIEEDDREATTLPSTREVSKRFTQIMSVDGEDVPMMPLASDASSMQRDRSRSQAIERGMYSLMHGNGMRNDYTGPNSDVAIDFVTFIQILSAVRKVHHAKMKEELAPLFERCLRKGGWGDLGVLGVSEVFDALTLQGMAPKNHEEQKQIRTILDEADEWGFEPQTLDYDKFVSFLRSTKEWVNQTERSKERDMAFAKFNFNERMVNEFRLAYDALDESGQGLHIGGVRKIFKMFCHTINSDQLRELFSRLDEDNSGMLNFMEFLSLVNMLDHLEDKKSANNRPADFEQGGWDAPNEVQQEIERRISQDISLTGIGDAA